MKDMIKMFEVGDLVVSTKGNPEEVKGGDTMKLANVLFISAHATIYEHEDYESAISAACEAAYHMVESVKDYIKHLEEEGEKDEV